MRSTPASRLLIRSFALLFACSSFAVAQKPARSLPVTSIDQSDVIVILKDQMSSMPAARGVRQSRAATIASSQSALIDRLQIARQRPVRSFKMLNAFATRVTSAEAADLASRPEVKAVVTDAVIHLPHSTHLLSAIASSAPKSSVTAASADTASALAGLCNTLEPEALQLTHTAYADSSMPQAQRIVDGHGKLITGAGVKVAFLADGLDVNNPGFIRPDGSHVFTDYQDFSGDPAGTPTSGGEAFGDASSIAAQDNPNGSPLLFDISQYVSAAHPLPSPCNIRIRGMAPGASLVGLKIFSNYATTTSNFVQAIEWAIFEDDVDVINESFGGNPYFDQGNDPISLANHLAVEAGITVVVSTGDAGTAGTLGSPATDPYVIAAGASTQFRLYAQTHFGAQSLATGVLSGNISSFSSGGYAQRVPRTVDIVAPGDSGWALCSTDVSLYQDCSTFGGNPSPIEDFGGTSESAPLTAGEAALIIQAYRSTHGGANPTPALVKKIIMSTATDLGAPANEQGAGLIDSRAAVHAALSLNDANGTPPNRGQAILVTPNSGPIVSEPDTQHSKLFVVTNEGSTPRHLSPRLQSLSEPVGGAKLTLNLAPATDPTFPNVAGAPRSYITQTFNVTSEADHLDVAIAFPPFAADGVTGLAVYIALLDPSGEQAAYSEPQGFGNGYAHVDIVKPAPGKWTAIIFTRPTGATSYTGPVHFTWSTERFALFGSVHPSTLDLAPGASGVVQASFSMPSQPGDTSVALRFLEDGALGNHPSIPLTLRTLVPLKGGKGSFSGALTGGNGRAGAAPTQSFEFEVPEDSKALSLAIETADPGDLLEGLLVDPNGIQLSVEPNLDPVTGKNLGYLQLFHEHPQAGLWHFILALNFTASGNQTSLPFQGHISLKDVPYSVTGLPDSVDTKLSATATPIQVAVTVKNTGKVKQEFFADARLRDRQQVQLPQYLCSATDSLPGACIYTYVPPEVDKIDFVAQSEVPITFDASNSAGYGVAYTGNPDIFSHPAGFGTAEASLSVPEVPWGYWFLIPSEIGPYGPAGAPAEPLVSGIAVNMRPFDSSVSSDSGNAYTDLTLGTQTYNPLILAPGATGVIHVTITPDPSQVGSTVKGYIFLDTYNGNVSVGDEVARIPYAYTIVH